MNKNKEPVCVMYDAPEAAHYKTDIKGWVSRNGYFFGDLPHSEHQARYDGSTHKLCEKCGKLMGSKSYCSPCQDLHNEAVWQKMPIVDWDGVCMICIHNDDQYFSDPDEFFEWCHDNDVEDPSSIRLVATNPVRFREVDGSYWEDGLPEDGELPDEIQKALNVLNKTIREYKTVSCWHAANRRIILETPSDWKVQ